MYAAIVAGGLAFVKFVVIPGLIFIVGQEKWDDYTYEDRVESCVEQVKTLTENESFINEAELNCRKTLR